MSSELKPTFALLSCLILIGCTSHQSTSDNLAVDPTLSSCAPLKALQAPAGFTLPPQQTTYQLPPKPLSSAINPSVDLRPPLQPLALLPGSEAYYQGSQAILQWGSATEVQTLWPQLKQCLKQLGVIVATQHNSQQPLTTRWIQETAGYNARYHLTLSLRTLPATLTVKLVELQKQIDAKEAPQRLQKVTITPDQQRHYAVRMLNRLTTALEAQRTAIAAPIQEISAPEKLDNLKSSQ